MDALTAFQAEKQTFSDALAGATNLSQAITAAEMTLEKVSAAMARDDNDEESRQRAQIVLSMAKKAPLFLRAARATGRIVIDDGEPKAEKSTKFIAVEWIGWALMLVPAIYELFSRRLFLALIGLAGLVICLLNKSKKNDLPKMHAEGVLAFDAKELMRETEELCRLADAATLDMRLLQQESGQRQSGEQEEALLDLALSLYENEAVTEGKPSPEAEQMLRRLGIEAIFYTPGDNRFEVLPTKGNTITVRPALVRDGQLLRRGVAAVAMQEGRA